MSLRVLFLVHGGPRAIEAVRVAALAQALPPGSWAVRYREGGAAGTLKAWLREIRRLAPELVYVLNTALPGAVLLPLLGALRGQRYVLDTGDAVFEMAKSSGLNAGGKLPLLWLFETLAQRRASAVVVRGREHAALLKSQGIRRVEVIPDGYAPQQAVPAEEVAALKAQLGLQGKFVVGVMGSLVHAPRLDICYGWDLVRALKYLPDPRIHALVIGDGDGLPWLKKLAAAEGVSERITFTGRIPYAEVPRHLRLMDIALSTQTNNIAGRVRTTGKLPEYMAAGCFVLASRVGEAARVLPEPMLLDYAGAVDASYPERLAARIAEVQQRPEWLALRDTLPAIAEREFNYPQSAEKLAALVTELTQGGRP